MIFVDIFFAFFNSALLFVVFWYIFQNKIAPGVDEEAYLEQRERSLLSDERVALGHNLMRIDQERDFRDHRYREMMEKVALWVQHEDKVMLASSTELQKNNARYCYRLERQNKHARLLAVKRSAVPKALATAERCLREQYCETCSADEFIGRAVNALVGENHV